MAIIEMRFKDCGFVYTKNTRMLFWTRRNDKQTNPDLVISAASGWPEPNAQDVSEVRGALVQRYPERNLFADGSEGLVPIYKAKP